MKINRVTNQKQFKRTLIFLNTICLPFEFAPLRHHFRVTLFLGLVYYRPKYSTSQHDVQVIWAHKIFSQLLWEENYMPLKSSEGFERPMGAQPDINKDEIQYKMSLLSKGNSICVSNFLPPYRLFMRVKLRLLFLCRISASLHLYLLFATNLWSMKSQFMSAAHDLRWYVHGDDPLFPSRVTKILRSNRWHFH